VAYESILSAVEAAMGMFEENDPPKLMFHKETGLLLVGGTRFQTEVVDNLVKRVRDDLQRRWAEEGRSRNQSASLRSRTALAKTELQIADKELVMAEAQLARVTQLADEGVTSRDEAAQARMNVDRARATLERRKIEFEAASEGIGGTADAEDSEVRLYEVGDIAGRHPELFTVVQIVTEKGGGESSVKDGRDKNPASIEVRGDDRLHATVKALLDNMRKRSKSSGK
jgi:hypothetical protein